MTIYSNAVRIPVLIFLLLSGVTLTVIWLYKGSFQIEQISGIISWATLALSALFLVYVLITVILAFFKIPIFLLGIPIGLLIYIGALMVSFAQVKNVVMPLIDGDVNLFLLGVAVVAVGSSFLAWYEYSPPEETLKQLGQYTGDLGSKVDALKKTQLDVGDMIDSVSGETRKYFEAIGKIVKESRK